MLASAPPAMFQGKGYEAVVVGDQFTSSLTVTETHLVLAAGLFGDFNPLHVDDRHARKTRFRGRILHGTFTSALMGAPIGMYFHGTAIAYLEHNCRFTAPVHPGDTLATTWKVAGKISKAKHKGGIVELQGECRNQRGEIVAKASGKVLVARSR